MVNNAATTPAAAPVAVFATPSGHEIGVLEAHAPAACVRHCASVKRLATPASDSDDADWNGDGAGPLAGVQPAVPIKPHATARSLQERQRVADASGFTTITAIPFDAVKRALDAIERAAPDDSPAFPPTPFHSSAAPPMSLSTYAHRVAYYTGYGVEGLSIGLALMARFAQATARPPTYLMLHRLLLACVTVGAKACFDDFAKNVYVAQASGVSLEELNWLEARILDALGFSAIPFGDEPNRAVSHALHSGGRLL